MKKLVNLCKEYYLKASLSIQRYTLFGSTIVIAFGMSVIAEAERNIDL